MFCWAGEYDSLPMLMMYLTDRPEQEERLGSYERLNAEVLHFLRSQLSSDRS